MSIEINASKGIQQNTTEVTKIPVGTTAQRPASPQAGMIRFNTDTVQVEGWNPAFEQWQSISEPFVIQATGGTVTDITQDGKEYRVHTFTSSGTFEFTSGDGEVEYLVVAGGGSGGGEGGGGGGAGGYRSSVQGESSGENTSPETPLSLTVGTYTVTVGGPSQDSTFDTITSTRGGSSSAGAGGSGAGAAARFAPEVSRDSGGAGTTGQGHNGGSSYNAISTSSPRRSGGGGGGAGEPGPRAERANPGNGGDGIESSINGTDTYYAGGGAGHNMPNSTATRVGGLGGGGGTNQAGQSNTGGGGGSPGSNPGGSGIVIVRYEIG